MMIGRAAQGRPWLFREIEHYLNTGTHLMPPKVSEIHEILVTHLEPLRVPWHRDWRPRRTQAYLVVHPRAGGIGRLRHMMNQLPDIIQQRQAVNDFFYSLAQHTEHLNYID